MLPAPPEPASSSDSVGNCIQNTTFFFFLSYKVNSVFLKYQKERKGYVNPAFESDGQLQNKRISQGELDKVDPESVRFFKK